MNCPDCGNAEGGFHRAWCYFLKGDKAIDTSSFAVKDSGERAKFASGMVRDTDTDKTDTELIFNGPMADRWAAHLTKGAKKYPDVRLGVPNWTLAEGDAELIRFRKSAVRHFRQWLRGETDEDHAAAVFFNVNGYEYVKGKMPTIPVVSGKPGSFIALTEPPRMSDATLKQEPEPELKCDYTVKPEQCPRCTQVARQYAAAKSAAPQAEPERRGDRCPDCGMKYLGDSDKPCGNKRAKTA